MGHFKNLILTPILNNLLDAFLKDHKNILETVFLKIWLQINQA